MATIGLKVKQSLGLLSPPTIIPYRGLGNSQYAHVQGHILENKLINESNSKDQRYKNMIGMVGRYMSSPIPDIRVKATFCGQSVTTKTNKEGLFKIDFHFGEPLKDCGWLPVHYEVLDQILVKQGEISSDGEIYIEEDSSHYGIITDVDDTIIISKATSSLQKLWLILTKNSKTRMPFEGVSEFYKDLHIGTQGDFTNPVFYVSSSEWNLYDFLEDFCSVRQLPKGVFLLQDLKVNLWKLIKTGGGNHLHKEEKIRKILSIFRNMPFILIGDSGQHDAEIYSRITKEYPGRIKSIYIRDVRVSRKVIVQEIADGIKEVDMLLVKDTKMAHEHAKVNNIIR